MYPARRIYPFRRSPWRGSAAVLPWIFVLGIVAGSMLPAVRDWRPGARWTASAPRTGIDSSSLESGERLRADVIRVIDGDTFSARVHVRPGLDITARVRLRGIDAPELKAACAEEYRMARAASTALRQLLAEGGVTIFNVGPDKYQGRVVADAATAHTASVSDALLAAGHGRRYGGGHRDGWCG